MKKTFNLFLALVLVASFQGCKPTPEEAIDYNDSVIHEYNAVIAADNKLMDAWDKEPADMDAARKELVDRLNKSIENIKKLDKFDGSTAFADEAVKCLTIHKAVAETEYKEMVDINSKPLEQMTDSDDHRFSELNELTLKKIQDAEKIFNTFQEDFAKKYKYEFKKDSV